MPAPAPAAPLAGGEQAIVTKVEPGLLIINTALRYNSEAAAGTDMVINADGLVLDGGGGDRRSMAVDQELAAAHRTFADRLADRLSLTIPSPDPDYGGLGQAFPLWPGPGNDVIVQPSKPEIRPPPQILQRAADRDADRRWRLPCP